MEHLSGVLTDQGVTDSILTELSDNDLSEMGIDKLLERKRLLTASAVSGAAQNEPGALVEVRGGVLPGGRRVGDFAIGKFAVTMEDWQVVRTWGLEKGYPDLPPGKSGGLRHPVTEVSWNDAVKWCNARSEMEWLTVAYQVADGAYRRGENKEVVLKWESGGYRLPSEAE